MAFVVVENGETRLISLEDNINLVDNILTVTPRIIDKVQKILKHDKNNDKNNDKDVKFQEDIDKKKKVERLLNGSTARNIDFSQTFSHREKKHAYRKSVE